jgi:hypothetical protein
MKSTRNAEVGMMYWRLYLSGVLETITISSIDADGRTTPDVVEVPRQTESVRSTEIRPLQAKSYAARKISIQPRAFVAS